MSEQDKSQKTEEPTPKRLAEAHEKGQVAKSQEVSYRIRLISSDRWFPATSGSRLVP